ncbi:Lnb N-terminal periplasmic domain-containing protein [Persephonella sp.]
MRLHRKCKTLLAGLLVCLLSIHSSAEENNLEKLADNPVWLKLLHFRDGHSEIDDPDFFLSEKGSVSPLDELKATVKLFSTSTEKGDNHPICRYPARYTFLKKHLNIKLKVQPECSKLEEYLKEVRPHSVSIVFSDYYINSPASMYGHTFLRIDPPFKSSLLGYAVNYAANTDGAEGIAYYIKGLTGKYRGFFSIFPYYKKIFEYNHLESRNLWEYHLKLTEEEARFIALHVWELKDHYAYYYFFDKNCSYQILYLIDIVRPQLNLTERFSLWTIPVDTIREIKKSGLIDRVYFRPSATTLISSFIEKDRRLTENEITTAKKVAQFKTDPEEVLNMKIPPKQKARILELSKLLFMYTAVKNRMEKDEYRKKLLKILKARSKVRYRVKPYIEKPAPPDSGHRPQKFSLIYGTDDGQKTAGFLFRTAYHGIEDDDTGYLFGSEVIFPSVKVLFYPDTSKLVVDRLTFVKISSLSRRNIIFKPLSWGVNFSIKRLWDKKKKLSFLHLSFSAGHTYGTENLLLFFGTYTGGELSVNRINRSRLSAGGKLTLLVRKNTVKTVFQIRPLFTAVKDGFKPALSGKLAFNLKTGSNSSITLKSEWVRLFYKNRYLLQFSVNRFF